MSKFVMTGFADEINSQMKVQMDTLDLTDIRYIELRGVNGQNVSTLTEAQAEAVAADMASRGYKVSAIGSPIGKIRITDDFEPHLEQFRHCLRLAKIFDTKYIRMFSFYGPEGGDVTKYKDEVFFRWEAFLKAAQNTDITLLHENEKDIYGDVASRSLELAEKLGVGLIFDAANFIQSGEEPYPKAYQMLRKHIRYMHIKDALHSDRSIVPPGLGDANYVSIFKELNESGFEGFVSMEPHLGHFQGLADLEPESKTHMMADGGPKTYLLAVEALYKVFKTVGITPSFTM